MPIAEDKIRPAVMRLPNIWQFVNMLLYAVTRYEAMAREGFVSRPGAG